MRRKARAAGASRDLAEIEAVAWRFFIKSVSDQGISADVGFSPSDPEEPASLRALLVARAGEEIEALAVAGWHLDREPEMAFTQVDGGIWPLRLRVRFSVSRAG